jgi:phage repressor protein C with HTH and peptisase S24 domain
MSTALADRIRARAKQLDVSMTRLAADADLNRTFVYDILYGRSQKPTREKLERLAEQLKVGVEWLVTGEGRVEGTPPGRSGDDAHVAIRSVKVRPSMGGGRIVQEVEEGEPFHFLARWVRNTLNVQPDDLRIMRVEGDSMEPTLSDGDAVLVDLTKRLPSPPGIFVLHDGMGLVAKRLELLPNTDPPRLRIVSDNQRYAPYEVAAVDVNMVGRIRWFCRAV